MFFGFLICGNWSLGFSPLFLSLLFFRASFNERSVVGDLKENILDRMQKTRPRDSKHRSKIGKHELVCSRCKRTFYVREAIKKSNNKRKSQKKSNKKKIFF